MSKSKEKKILPIRKNEKKTPSSASITKSKKKKLNLSLAPTQLLQALSPPFPLLLHIKK